MEKKQIEKQVTFSLKENISLIFVKSNTFVRFNFKDLGQKYVKIPDFIDSIQLKKNNNSIVFISNIDCSKRVEKFALFLLSYPQNYERPFRKKLLLKGLGFKVSLIKDNRSLELKLGFSHFIILDIPEQVSAKINKQSINIEGFNKVSVGNFASSVRRLRLPDSYKGKGVWYKNEVRVLKELKKK